MVLRQSPVDGCSSTLFVTPLKEFCLIVLYYLNDRLFTYIPLINTYICVVEGQTTMGIALFTKPGLLYYNRGPRGRGAPLLTLSPGLGFLMGYRNAAPLAKYQ